MYKIFFSLLYIFSISVYVFAFPSLKITNILLTSFIYYMELNNVLLSDLYGLSKVCFYDRQCIIIKIYVCAYMSTLYVLKDIVMPQNCHV